MARIKIEVDRAKLEQAIQQAEVNGPLKNQSLVWKLAAEIYNKMDPPKPINFPVVMLRAGEWGIQIKTPMARKRSPVSEPDSEPEVASSEPAPERVRGADSFFLRVITPAGACPVKLTDQSPEAIEAWKESVRQVGIEQKKVYTDEALDYWLRYP